MLTQIFESSKLTVFDAALILFCPLAAAIGGCAHVLILQSKYDKIPAPGSMILLPRREAMFKGFWIVSRLFLSAIIGLVVALYFLGTVKEEVATLGKLLAFSILIGYSAPRIWSMQAEIMEFKARELAEKMKSEGKKSPNNAMEPTPVNVTVPANAGPAPFTSAAHLER